MRRRSDKRKLMILFLGMFLLIILGLLVSIIFSLGRGSPEDTVRQFYEFEQSGDFGDSWQLLHPLMQERFDRAAYVQDRAHVFIGHFGAETFSFDIREEKKRKNWKMVKDGKTFETVYEFQVEKNYHGKYGHFLFVQYVYVVRVNKEWRILWDYKK